MVGITVNQVRILSTIKYYFKYYNFFENKSFQNCLSSILKYNITTYYLKNGFNTF